MLSNELQEFLKEMFPKEAKRIVFTPEMKLYQNFKMAGDDVEEFLLCFMKRFNVKLGESFNFQERFYLEYDSLSDYLLLPFTAIKRLVSAISGIALKEEKKDLTFAELDEAIQAGVLE